MLRIHTLYCKGLGISGGFQGEQMSTFISYKQL